MGSANNQRIKIMTYHNAETGEVLDIQEWHSTQYGHEVTLANGERWDVNGNPKCEAVELRFEAVPQEVQDDWDEAEQLARYDCQGNILY
jgi:hypothetical protein